MVSVLRARRTGVACALALAGALPPLAMAQSSVDVGDRVAGEITSRSRLNYSDGSRSDTYSLSLQKDDTILLRTEGALCARLGVFEQGTQLGDSARGGQDCVEGDGTARLSFRAPASGRYEIAVSGLGPRAYGPYRLAVERIEAYRGGALRSGSDISDLLRPEGNRYTLEVAELGQYVIDMRSGEFDAVLSLAGNGVELEDDDGGNRLDARIRALLEPGSYTLHARSLDEAGGAFGLAVQHRPLEAGPSLRNSGPLETDGPALRGALAGAPREYSLVLEQRRLVTVELASDDFDTYLEIVGAQARVRDDDSAGDANSRIVTVLDPGTYTVRAGAASPASGLFTLRASTAAVPSRAPGTLGVGGNASASLVAGGKDRYTVNISRAGVYRFHAAATSLDLMLDLVRGGERLHDDDDSGGGTDAAIEAGLEPGTYELVVSAWGQEGGRYRVSASRVP